MDILVIVGSKSRTGQTARAVQALEDGCLQEGATTHTIFLPEMDVHVCNQCGPDNWGTCKTRGVCSIKDDFASIKADIRKADAVVFATPVFYDDVSESIQAFTRRLRRTTSNPEGKEGIAEKPAVVMAVAGARGKGAAECCANLEGMLKGTGFDVVDLLPIRKQNLEDKLESLKTVGAWLTHVK